eukprot:Awhi_evm1s6163
MFPLTEKDSQNSNSVVGNNNICGGVNNSIRDMDMDYNVKNGNIGSNDDNDNEKINNDNMIRTIKITKDSMGNAEDNMVHNNRNGHDNKINLNDYGNSSTTIAASGNRNTDKDSNNNNDLDAINGNNKNATTCDNNDDNNLAYRDTNSKSNHDRATSTTNNTITDATTTTTQNHIRNYRHSSDRQERLKEMLKDMDKEIEEIFGLSKFSHRKEVILKAPMEIALKKIKFEN